MARWSGTTQEHKLGMMLVGLFLERESTCCSHRFFRERNKGEEQWGSERWWLELKEVNGGRLVRPEQAGGNVGGRTDERGTTALEEGKR